MIYNECYRDLFTVPEEYKLAHCISADFGMGKGIVLEFNRLFDMKRKLQRKYPDFVNEFHKTRSQGACILEGRVLNLITKERYFEKPTYTSIRHALISMKRVCANNSITKVAMPVIGCGLDKLEWSKVSSIIKEIFENTDIEILVCKNK